MIKKLLGVAAAALAVVMMLTVTVFADEGAITIEAASGTDNIYETYTVQLRIASNTTGTDNNALTWFSGTANASVDATGLVTCDKAGTAEIYAYDPIGRKVSNTIKFTINDLDITDIRATIKSGASNAYFVGQYFDKSTITVDAKYTDDANTWIPLGESDFTVEPTRTLTEADTTVTIKSSNGKTTNFPITVSAIADSRFIITSPTAGTKYTAGDTIDPTTILIEVTQNNGNTYILNGSHRRVTYNPSGSLTTSDTTLSVSLDNGTAQTVNITVANAAPTEVTARVTKQPTKTAYIDGEKFEPAGMRVTFTYSGGSTPYADYTVTYTSSDTSTTTMTAGATEVSFLATDNKGNSRTVTVTGLTVEEKLNIVGLDPDEDKYVIDDEAKISVGDKLDWEEIFEEVTVIYKDTKTRRQTIKNEDALEKYFPGAELLLEVYKKTSNADTIEADDVDDGEIELVLYIKYAGETITSKSYIIRFTMEVADAECSVMRYNSNNKLQQTVIYETLREALDALEDGSCFDTLNTKDSIKIKLGENQTLSSSYRFEPEFENDMTIDLNGNSLTLSSEWITYNSDNDEIVIIITNEKEDKSGTLVYRDKSITTTIEESDELEFKEDQIPGIYTVTIKSGITNGKVTANKTSVGHGGEVKFTITPETGYSITDVKLNNVSVIKESDYTVSTTTGVGTYTLKNIKENAEITATFEKTTTTTEWKNPFSDIKETDQYYDAVKFVCENGLFNGMSTTKFEPRTTMTRAMFVTVLGRLADINTTRYSGSSFTDVSSSDASISWAVPYIEWATQNGIVQGYGNGKFGPNDPITHQQMYVLMDRYATFVEHIYTNLTNVRITVSDKADIDTWAEEGVKFATNYNLLITSGGKLTPRDNALRCELAMLLKGFCENVLKIS